MNSSPVINGSTPAGPSHQNGILDSDAKNAQSAGPFPRLSRPVELMRDSYDVVVIGSGYGGGVAASRMARGGQSVCVLERGKEKWPGEFPEKLLDTLKELHVSGEFAPGDRRGRKGMAVEGGDPTGLYHLIVGDGQNVFVGNGLGGTSLLNANVFMEAHPKVLEWKAWPEELRGKEAWKKYYDRAREVLEPTTYPESFPSLPKAEILKRQAEAMGWGESFYPVPQTTRFCDGPNSSGVPMRASTLTGQDATGINDGSKSTTLVTYIADAWNWGAEIFCGCEVRYITKAPDREGYLVHFGWHSHKRTAFKNFYQDLMWVHARKLVFLGAGTLGTTEILLRSKQMGLEITRELGHQMSGNGDMLAFGYNTDYNVNAIGRPNVPPESPVGPCITSVIDRRNVDNTLEGFVIQDCAVPEALAPLMYPMLETLGFQERIRSIKENIATRGVSGSAMKLLARLGSRLFGPYYPNGSIYKSPTYLIMSHDSSQGTLTLWKDKPILRYSGVGRSQSVSRIHSKLQEATAAVGGTFVPSPFYAIGQQQITVHPIGGARISKDGTGARGVTNHMGEVLTGSGSDTHHGLIVCDGSMIPVAVGVNPFATITALAERNVELVAEKNGIAIDYNTKNGPLNLFGQPRILHPQPRDIKRMAKIIDRANNSESAGMGFSEVMSGYIQVKGLGDTNTTTVLDIENAAQVARKNGETASFFLSVKFWDIRELRKATHSAVLTGTFSSAALGGVFIVNRGEFQLFSQDPREPDTTNLSYEFDMVAPSGRKLHFSGYKVVNTAATFNPIELWKETTTLYVTIKEMDGRVVGLGMLYIHPDEFVQEVQTLQPSGPGLLARAGSLASFLTYFSKNLAVPFLSPLNPLQYPTLRTDSTFRETRIAATYKLEASDKVASLLHMWNPAGQNTSDAAPIILFLPGASVDHQIFALPTIEKNAVEYFTEAGYRTYSLTHRVGRTVVACNGYTSFDARLDIFAALARIRNLTQAAGHATQAVYVIAHCAGSVALACGLLDGTIPGVWIKGITASNVFMNPRFATVNHLKASLPIALSQVYNKLIGSWYDCTSSPNDAYIQQALNQALRFYPVGEPRESCRSVVCSRSRLVFGRLWSHKSLNEATHANLERFLGGIAMNTLAYFVSSGNRGHVTTNESINLVTPENLKRLQEIPILFISGAENGVYTPENTDTSYTTLCHANGREWYERVVFEGRGHLDCWMGATAYLDVYPRVKEHVENVKNGVLLDDRTSGV